MNMNKEIDTKMFDILKDRLRRTLSCAGVPSHSIIELRNDLISEFLE